MRSTKAKGSQRQLSFDLAISSFGVKAKAKLANPTAKGEPEDQLRGPLDHLLSDLAVLLGHQRDAVVAVGESSIRHLKTRPDFAVTVDQVLVGFMELKAPGKGADPRKFKEGHDRDQWAKLRRLPNLIYTDGNEFSLWHDGDLDGPIVSLDGDIESSGRDLKAPAALLTLVQAFLDWEPTPPRGAKELAQIAARLCGFLRDEVMEQLSLQNEALTSLAVDWRKLLFPDSTDERFADGYAQAVTFGMLMARARGIHLSVGLEEVARELAHTSSLIGAALRLLTESAEGRTTLGTSLRTLTRVLDAVDWATISKGQPDAWLYFYEDFLEVYDRKLRRQTGSYYTPPEVVSAMVRLVDEALRSRFGQAAGLASPAVTLADPAVGTGTFLLGALRTIAQTIKADEGPGSVKAAINASIKRMIAFEIQLGPFAVAQLRTHAEIVALTGAPPKTDLRMFVTNTLGNPDDDEGWITGVLNRQIAHSRKEANKIKREEPITVVIGNPPYKEKAKGLGGWVEGGDRSAEKAAPLADWMPPRDWGVGAHSKHLRNLYVYFWRWATWKVYDHDPAHNEGIVCFITAAGFLSGPGFQKMRAYLRSTCNDIWVIDCSPEGHQPDVNTRIFEDAQQPVCIVLASRSAKARTDSPATVRFRALPEGRREEKFVALAKFTLADGNWAECPSDWRAPFLPASKGAWATYPTLESLFHYNGSGVMTGRTWVIAPDRDSLSKRWAELVKAPAAKKEALFHPHLIAGEPGDRHSKRVVKEGLFGFKRPSKSVAAEQGACEEPIPYGFRSFDRQWIIPDPRLINRPNPQLWSSRSDRQIYLTAFTRSSPTGGPAVTVTALVPDLHHYKGSFGGRVFPLWKDARATDSNLRTKLLAILSERYGQSVSAEDLFAYIVSVSAHPTFTLRFQTDLSSPGLRIPITAEGETFRTAAKLGRTIIWLHTFGERLVDSEDERPLRPPRLASAKAPRISKAGAIPTDRGAMPEEIGYDRENRRLLIGTGYVENVSPAMWEYEVSGKQVLVHWFSYRRKDRERPILGDRRRPSSLGDIQPDCWLAEYTTELINVLHVLGRLVELESAQAEILERVCAGETITEAELQMADAFDVPKGPHTPDMFEAEDEVLQESPSTGPQRRGGVNQRELASSRAIAAEKGSGAKRVRKAAIRVGDDRKRRDTSVGRSGRRKRARGRR